MIGVSNKWTDKENEVIRPIIKYRALVKNYNVCRELYESLYPSIASQLREVAVSASGGNSMEDKIVSILDHRAYLLKDLLNQLENIHSIERMVSDLPEEEAFVIRKYYMSEHRMRMEDIAEEFPASVESCWRWRRKAIARLVKNVTVNDSET